MQGPLTLKLRLKLGVAGFGSHVAVLRRGLGIRDFGILGWGLGE